MLALALVLALVLVLTLDLVLALALVLRPWRRGLALRSLRQRVRVVAIVSGGM